MRTIIEREKGVPVVADVDVLVVGGGAAGVGAAVAAARNGMNTLLVEREWSLGGLATLDLVLALGGFAEGISKEFLDNLEAEGALLGGRICDPEKAKYVMEQLVLKSGAKILYGTSVIDSIVEDNVIKGVIVHNKSGRQAILAKIVVDCSGDGDVAAYAGAPFEVGNPEFGGYNMSTSLDFRLGGVNWSKYVEAQRKFLESIREKEEVREFYLDVLQREAVKNGDLPYVIHTGSYMGPLPGRPENNCEVYVCLAHSRNCRNLDANDLTRQIIEQRQQVMWLVNFFRRYVPGFENCWLIDIGSILGVRDSRRIIGEYVLTEEDKVLARKFEDAVVRDLHYFDLHHPTSAEEGVLEHIHLPEPKEPAVCRPAVCSPRWHPYVRPSGGYEARCRPGEYNEIPYRCLVPLKIENLLVAGRCISTTAMAQSATRLILTCMNMGQAAGTAAALCVKNNVTPRKLDAKLLRETLIKQGVPLDKEPPVVKIPKDARFKIVIDHIEVAR
jgi:hypothetical protein